MPRIAMVLKILVALEHELYATGDLVVFLADDFGGEGS